MQSGYRSLWERVEELWLGINAWDVMNPLFKSTDVYSVGKIERRRRKRQPRMAS